MYGRKIYGLCMSAQLLETAAHRGKQGSQLIVKPRSTDFSIVPRLSCVCQWRKRAAAEAAGQLCGECGRSSALVRRKWVEPRLAALVGPVYIRDRSFKHNSFMNQCRLGVTRPHLWHNEAIKQHWSGSKLTQVINGLLPGGATPVRC